MAAALLLLGAALLRPFAAAALLELRRRRAFEPTRVREVIPLLAWTGLGLAALALVASLLSLLTPWLTFLRGSAQPAAGAGLLLWVVLPLIGGAVAIGLVRVRGRSLVDLSARGQAVLAGWLGAGVYASDRFLRRSGLGVVEAFEGGVEGGEAALGRSLAAGAAGVPALPANALLALSVVVVVVLAVAGALLAPGVAR